MRGVGHVRAWDRTSGVFRGALCHDPLPPLADGKNFLMGLKTGGRSHAPPLNGSGSRIGESE
jgi:hypothetical protein